jgi:hypothetical protein
VNQTFLKVFFFITLTSCISSGFSRGVEFSNEPTHPPRTIRVCCAFGSNVGVMGIPNFQFTEITGIEYIGKHQYLGTEEEKNGIIYTLKGGFIDMGHLRDQADWTAFLYHIITKNKGIPNFEFKLGYERGFKKLLLNVPADITDINAINLAGRIAYDLSVWHEIATWYGPTSVPLLPERYSSFSIEDNYSNLLGATLGIEALKSDLPYNEAMTKLIDEKLTQLERVDSVSQTYNAMEKVLNKWWTRDFQFPQANVMLKREFSTYSYTYPLIVPGLSDPEGDVCVLDIPKLVDTDLKFEDLYTLSFKINGKIPLKNVNVNSHTKTITSRDFLPIIQQIAEESNKKLSKIRKIYGF